MARLRRPSRPSRKVFLALAGVLVLAVVVVAAVLVVRRVTTTPQERYCDELDARRAELTATLSRSSDDGLIVALPILEDLRERAPEDLRDEWRQVVDAVQGLRDALDDADVDPASYDRDDPPTGVTDAQKDRIDQAATVLGSAATRAALLGIDQHARDVCGTPLTQ